MVWKRQSLSFSITHSHNSRAQVTVLERSSTAITDLDQVVLAATILISAAASWVLSLLLSALEHLTESQDRNKGTKI